MQRQSHGERDNGILIGLISNLDDPEKIGRVKVKFPELGNVESDWARLATLMAGAGRGTFFRPEVDDEVLVAFEHGDPRRPYIVGCLWSQADGPPPDDGQPTQNNWRCIVSRSGHTIRLDDTQGKERIEVIDKDGERQVIIDSANRKIQVICATGDVEVKAGAGSIKVEATTVEISATGNMTLNANGTMIIKGQSVLIN
jgi:uncharacterized protein involved in type VI secretion and phage assembly